MAIDYAVLKNECLTDPTGLGLTTWFQQAADGKVAELLNTVKTGIQIARSNVTPQEIIEAIDVRDLSASATTLQASWFESFTQTTSGVSLLKANGADARILTNLLRIMSNTNNSETRLRALATRNGSRAEQLFGENALVTANDVAIARGI